MQFPLQTIDQLKPIIQGFRKQAGLTQAAMADKLGITQQSYAQIESNLHATSVERLYTILRLLNVELNFSLTSATAPDLLIENVDRKSGAVKLRRSTAINDKKPARKQASSQSVNPVALRQPDKTKW